jgi:hypothetical protein
MYTPGRDFGAQCEDENDEEEGKQANLYRTALLFSIEVEGFRVRITYLIMTFNPRYTC